MNWETRDGFNGAWKNVELYIDGPTLEVAKIFVGLGISYISTAEKYIAVAELLELGADMHVVLCQNRSEESGCFWQTLEMTQADRLAKAFWNTWKMDNYVDKLTAPLIEIAYSADVEMISLCAQRGARINRVIEKVTSRGHSAEDLKNPFCWLHGIDHLKAI